MKFVETEMWKGTIGVHLFSRAYKARFQDSGADVQSCRCPTHVRQSVMTEPKRHIVRQPRATRMIKLCESLHSIQSI